MDLIPPGLIVARYFAAEQAAIGALQTTQETAARELEEFVEEHTGEEGLLGDAANDKGKVTKSGVKDRIKTIQERAGKRRGTGRPQALSDPDRGRGRGSQGRQGRSGPSGPAGAGPLHHTHRG